MTYNKIKIYNETFPHTMKEFHSIIVIAFCWINNTNLCNWPAVGSLGGSDFQVSNHTICFWEYFYDPTSIPLSSYGVWIRYYNIVVHLVVVGHLLIIFFKMHLRFFDRTRNKVVDFSLSKWILRSMTRRSTQQDVVPAQIGSIIRVGRHSSNWALFN